MCKQETLNQKKKIDYSPRSRYSVEQWGAGEKKSFKRYAGEMVYLERMIRDCEIKKMEKRKQKEEGERKRKDNDKAKIEEEVVKRIETAKEEWVKQIERDKDEVDYMPSDRRKGDGDFQRVEG